MPLPLPVTFASLVAGNQPLSLMDTQFAAVESLITLLSSPLIADVAMPAAGTYYTGPQVAQGSVGVFFAVGTVTVKDPTNATTAFAAKLWDGTTISSTTIITTGVAASFGSMSLSGIFTNPAGNIRISVVNINTTTGSIIGNSGIGHDSSLAVLRLS
jgi:hypothetical protein